MFTHTHTHHYLLPLSNCTCTNGRSGVQQSVIIYVCSICCVDNDAVARLSALSCLRRSGYPLEAPQWGAEDAEIKVPSRKNTELKRSPFKAWSRSVYSHTCYAYCHGFLPCLFRPFRSIHLHFFQNLSRFFRCWLWTQIPVLSARGI